MRARMIGKSVVDPTFWMITVCNLPPRLSNPKSRNLAGSAAPPFALSAPAEITLIDLHLAAKQLGRFLIPTLSDYFPQFAEE